MNSQAPEKRSQSTCLEVVKYWPTIQGEGPYSGMRSIFVRLAGCNLKCPKCDTDYTSKRSKYDPSELAAVLHQEWNRSFPLGMSQKLFVITGGEPFRQNISPFILQLLSIDPTCKVQIETNGVFAPMDSTALQCDDSVTVVCSPKTQDIAPELRQFISAYKYVGEAGFLCNYDGLPTASLGYPFRPARPHYDPTKPYNERVPVYLQPLDDADEEKNRANLEACAESCMKFGYRLNVQLHKLANIE